jgi:hypothetical protein
LQPGSFIVPVGLFEEANPPYDAGDLAQLQTGAG